ncbi:uncharacterized protein LOC121519890 [Cheilinus undulatus]|uniref:uncharacterized protein LOC121519890 n=1 Tax=Cheilinus undulatus TaxID=241271 RepID=UPI001BD23B65|nr:uncharacterized protein LOC121519890 [Cheilinus undulatus]
MDSFVVVALFLLSSCEAQETPVFKRTGMDLLLDVKEVTLEEGHDLTWLFNGRTTIGRLFHGGKPIILGSYKSRAEFFEQNHSLLLKNVQLSDSGVYTARVNGDNVTDVAKYKLTVQDPVSRVELMVKSCSSDWSNLTVICRTLDSLISSTFTCKNQTCSHDRGEGTTPGASLDVYLENGSVICNHSNQVSSEEDARKIEDLCRRTSEHHNQIHEATLTPILLAIVLVPLAGVIVGALLYQQWKRKQHPEEMENTVYADPEALNTGLPMEKRPTNDASADPPPTIYSLLGPVTGPTEPTGPTSQEAPTQIRVNTQPESLYATVEKPAKS